MTKSSGGLTIPLSDSRLTSPFSQRGTIEDKQSLPLGKGRQMKVFIYYLFIPSYPIYLNP